MLETCSPQSYFINCLALPLNTGILKRPTDNFLQVVIMRKNVKKKATSFYNFHNKFYISNSEISNFLSESHLFKMYKKS